MADPRKTPEISEQAFKLAHALYVQRINELIAQQTLAWRKRESTPSLSFTAPSTEMLNLIVAALQDARDEGLNQAILLANRESDAGGKGAKRFDDMAAALKAMKSISYSVAEKGQ